jgi:signal transduction histidine kinase
MKQQGRSRTLQIFSVLWVVLPLMVVMSGLLLAGALAFERILTDLLVDRHREIAATAAVGVSEVIEGYAHILEALAANPELLGSSPERREAVLKSASDALEVFNAGVAILDRNGSEVTFASAVSKTTSLHLSQQEMFRRVQAAKAPIFSELIFDPTSRENYILVGAPILIGNGDFQGCLIGAVRTRTATLSKPIMRLKVGNDGYAYLVDGNGKVIFHPDETQIGVDYSSRPFYQQVMADRNSGTLWKSTGGTRLFEADASVAATGWALIVQESWESAAAPAQAYVLGSVYLGLFAILFVVLISWQGMRRISAPIQFLGKQTAHLSHGEPLEVFQKTGIQEIDDLERAFDEMARQITAYRAGLRRYIGDLTRSQENERRRIARELHDETVQNLLAVSRQLELSQLSEKEPVKVERLNELQGVLRDTLKGLRRITQDLRPLMLEDLGLIPALHALVRDLREGDRGVPHTHFEVMGEPFEIPIEHELAIYRVTQEALNNVRKHADATGVHVKLFFRQDKVLLEIEDSGKGFQVPDSLADFAQSGHFGLMGIQERVGALEGKLSIQSSKDKGTRVCIETPILRSS